LVDMMPGKCDSDRDLGGLRCLGCVSSFLSVAEEGNELTVERQFWTGR